ncbi:MAG TPA: hypothetical protein VGT07_13360 [Steroidobacteraceae bacterium]|nr:hypothetical protein [Steroidobacteraceae bacterium]
MPSLTEMPIFEYVPTLELLGVPLSWPVEALKAAQLGMLVIEKVRVPPLGSVVVGVNVYFCPATTLVAGVPEIVGALEPPPVDWPVEVPLWAADELSGVLLPQALRMRVAATSASEAAKPLFLLKLNIGRS